MNKPGSIKYQSLPELGIASERRADLNGARDYDRLFDEYEATTLRTETGALDRILNPGSCDTYVEQHRLGP